MPVETAGGPQTGPSVARGELFVVSAPSGTGKTTLIRAVFERYPELAARIAFSVSYTSRARRPGDVPGRDYHFVDEATFEQMIAEDRFLEWAKVFGNYYGTARSAVVEQMAGGADVLLDIDVQGALQVQQRLPEAHSIFILPPSFAELEARLRGRKSDGEEQIRRRLATASREIREVGHYDYVILNDDVAAATQALAAIFLARRVTRSRMYPRIAQVLDSFPALAE